MKKTECIKIYREAFGDGDPAFEKALFENCFCDCAYSQAEGKISSMFFALPCEIKNESDTLEAKYIYAVATLKEMQSKGYMTRLLRGYTESCNSLLFLRPANKALIEFYKNLGFKEIKAKSSGTGIPLVIPKGSFSKLAENIKTGDGQEFTLMYYSKVPQNIKNLNFIYSME